SLFCSAVSHVRRGAPSATLFPYTTLFRSFNADESIDEEGLREYFAEVASVDGIKGLTCNGHTGEIMSLRPNERARVTKVAAETVDRKSTRLNSSHVKISYAVFCL